MAQINRNVGTLKEPHISLARFCQALALLALHDLPSTSAKEAIIQCLNLVIIVCKHSGLH